RGRGGGGGGEWGQRGGAGGGGADGQERNCPRDDDVFGRADTSRFSLYCDRLRRGVRSRRDARAADCADESRRLDDRGGRADRGPPYPARRWSGGQGGLARQRPRRQTPHQKGDGGGAERRRGEAARPAAGFRARQAGSRPVAGADRNLHAPRLHPDRPCGTLRRLLLPLSRLGLRHLRTHPAGTRAAQPRAPALRIPLRHQDPNRLTASDFILQGSIMSGHPTYQPQSAFMRWMERRLPIGGLVYSSFVVYPTPRNLNYWWTFGGILAFMLGVQIVTGVVLAMHYTPQVDYAFDSVEQIMRDVNYG